MDGRSVTLAERQTAKPYHRHKHRLSSQTDVPAVPQTAELMPSTPAIQADIGWEQVQAQATLGSGSSPTISYLWRPTHRRLLHVPAATARLPEETPLPPLLPRRPCRRRAVRKRVTMGRHCRRQTAANVTAVTAEEHQERSVAEQTRPTAAGGDGLILWRPSRHLSDDAPHCRVIPPDTHQAGQRSKNVAAGGTNNNK